MIIYISESVKKSNRRGQTNWCEVFLWVVISRLSLHTHTKPGAAYLKDLEKW